ncbi:MULTISPECIES: helix-turn-helix domain-containing protein [Paraburkholderia]|uniref:helix-turn-helix domain-containing protein n=1 Tax=Paraburkholderia TaxID=1822464 RepID=UPI0022566660|nr:MULTISPECIES: helix-turn-helix domain-containing protein [Paraburkholderia]MCX4163607.1 helix-turn-helix domain-containing protein [Paraburkholderia megapolitana]MDN7159102.1 helix-turn-helix domain-containing protein [Paraburkholderia sp. CHISQ3]MDQ6496149.1 helix-turn-helix domain-containing protein [Paraburkholderia megapolitana]
MQLFVTSHTDVLEHSAAVLGWQQTYDQLECGRPRSTLTQLCGDGYQVFLESIDKRVAQRGRSPAGRLCIGVSWQDPTFDSEDWALASGVCQVALLRNGEPFNLHMPAGATLLSVNLDFARFRELALTCLDDARLRQIDDAGSIEVPVPVVARVAGRLRGVLQQAAGQNGLAASSCGDNDMVDLAMSGSLELFSGGHTGRTERCRSLAVSTWLVRRSEELLFDRAAVTLTVTDLCNQLKVSPRALQNSFHAVTGSAPVEYLRGLRLNAVRRRLATTSPDALGVGGAAAEMGFYHLSHFARHYRDLFGELPSNTRRARTLSVSQGIRQH